MYRRIVPWAALVAVAAVTFVACGGSSDDAEPAADPTSTSDRPTEPTQADSSTTEAAPREDLEMTAADFVNINSMTKVRNFYVDNRLGNLDEALAVAEAGTGTYPVGTIIQLVPQEAMVKRAEGWDAATNDWEFFFLEVDAKGTKIVTRGAADTVNQFGGNCADCHLQAKPEFDMICEKTNGCVELPLTDELIAGIQAADPRPMPS
jgi:hypothetical protein